MLQNIGQEIKKLKIYFWSISANLFSLSKRPQTLKILLTEKVFFYQEYFWEKNNIEDGKDLSWIRLESEMQNLAYLSFVYLES